MAFQLGAELTSSFKGAFSQADSMMSKLGAVAVAVGGSAILGSAITEVVTMENSLAKLSAQTGTYGEEMAALGDVAKNVFKAGHGESFDDVSAALMQVKNHMHNLDDGELERVTGNAMNLANTFDSEVNEVTRAANNLMTNFGMDSEKAFDMMAKGAQSGLNFSNEMFDNLSEYSPLWADMGYSAEQMFGILKNGAEQGVYNFDYLNDVMKEFQIRATDGSKSTLDAVSELSPETQKVWKAFSDGKATVADMSQAAVADLAKIDDKVKQNELGVALFGTKWEDLGGDVVMSMLAAGESLEDFEGAMQKINEVRFDTVGAALTGIGRILFVDLVMPIGEAALPILNKLANFLQNNLPAAISETKNTLRTIFPIILGITAGFVAYRTMLFVVTAAQATFNAIKVVSTVLLNAYRTAMLAYIVAGGGVRGIIVVMQGAMAALNATMLTNPFIAVAAAIIGVGVAFYAAYKMSDTFRNAVNNAFSAIVDFVSGAVDYVSSQAIAIWSALVSGAGSIDAVISGAVAGIGTLIASAIGSELSGRASEVISGFIESMKAGFSSLPGIISMIAPTIASIGLSFLGVSGPIAFIIAGIVSLVGYLYRLSQTNSTVASALTSAWQSIQSAFAPVIDVLAEGVAQFAAEVGPQLEQTMTVIGESITALGPSFAQLGTTLAQLATLMISLWAQVGASVITLATTALPVLLQVVTMIFPMILSVVQMVLPIIIQLLTTIVPIILQIAQMVLPILLQVVMMVFPMILSIIQMVLPIFVSLLTTIVGVVLQLAQAVLPILVTVVQMVFPIILSIIQMVIPIIVMVLQTLVMIINSVIIPAINGILAVVQFVFPYVQMLITNSLAIVNGVIQAAMALLQGDWDGAWNAIKATAETIMNNIISFFSSIDLVSVGKAIIQGLIDGISSMASAVGSAISALIPAPLKSAASSVLGAFPGFAKGGVVSSPTLAWIGEGGDTETIIPHNNAARSKQLWVGAGQALGMFDAMQIPQSSAEKPSFSNVKASDFSGGKGNVQFVLEDKREFNFNGGNPEEIREVIAMSDAELLEKIKEVVRNEGRLAF